MKEVLRRTSETLTPFCWLGLWFSCSFQPPAASVVLPLQDYSAVLLLGTSVLPLLGCLRTARSGVGFLHKMAKKQKPMRSGGRRVAVRQDAAAGPAPVLGGSPAALPADTLILFSKKNTQHDLKASGNGSVLLPAPHDCRTSLLCRSPTRAASAGLRHRHS